ncbi:hypothetical protein GTY20_39920 [Streptomyces sp. SID4946]|uniref:hypothetical protein n=1 Tax=Streptomyces sp. LamerLS-31b TaxID=1839765 RepID=UPI00081EC13C|nr:MULTISPECIES: hypothetical protein [unclassified Streptomyces]MYQ96942.1 hypothetical protein [Streptomyces sp. SID4946]SCF58629.1 hypothetical protein GA0115258_10202 [Streptomyces sp. LamerLS-31b]SCG02848.1 hypothetical protein GA0115256_14684 [Streptomyces sp. DconLS]
MGRPDKAARGAIAQRRTDAIDLRVAGVDWLTVGRKLAADSRINSDRVAYPQGYGIDRNNRGPEPPGDDQLINAACKDVRQALKERTTEQDEKADELRAVENLRLDHLFFVAYGQAVKDGDLPAIDRALRIMEHRARMNGLDRPNKTEIVTPLPPRAAS